jgi:hypothetical protein
MDVFGLVIGIFCLLVAIVYLVGTVVWGRLPWWGVLVGLGLLCLGLLNIGLAVSP